VLDQLGFASNAGCMTSDAVDERPSRPLLTLGRVDLVRVQVGHRALPDGPVFQQFLLDLPLAVADDDRVQDPFDEAWVLAALEPVLHAGDAPPRHYSLHTHRWHTSWGPSPGAFDLGLLVTTGTRAAASDAWGDSVCRAFRGLLQAAGRPEAPASRDAAVLRARRSAATAYAVDPDALSLTAEEHHRAEGSWTVGLRTTAGDEYDVLVGLVDGYSRSVRVRHVKRVEVFDSVGSE